MASSESKSESPVFSFSSTSSDVLQYLTVRTNTKALRVYSGIIALCGFPLGWDLGTTGNLLDMPDFRRRYQISQTTVGIVISVFNLGCIGACLVLLGLKIPHRGGCLASMRCGLLLVLVGYLVLWASVCHELPNLAFFCVGRFFCGVGCGVLAVVGPMYIGHLCTLCTGPQSYVSLFHVSVAFFAVAGNSLFFYSGSFVEHLNCLVQLSVPLLALGCSHFLPESPCDNASNEEALANILDKLVRVVNPKIFLHPDLLHALGNSPNGLSQKRKWRSVAVCCSLSALQQLFGISFFFYFGKSLLASVVGAGTHAQLPALFLTFCNLVGAVFSGSAATAFGLRWILVGGSACLSSLLVAFASLGLAFQKNTGSTPLAYAMTAIACSFVMVFAGTWGPGVGMASVHFSRENQSVMCCQVITGLAISSLVLSVTPPLMDRLGYGAIFAFSFFGVLSLGVAWNLETID